MEMGKPFILEHKDNSDLAWALGLKIASFLHLSSVVKREEGDETREGGSYDEDDKDFYTKENTSYLEHHYHNRGIRGLMYVAVKVMLYPSLLCYRIAKEVFDTVLHRILLLEFVQWILTQFVWAFCSAFHFTLNPPLSTFSSFVKRLLGLLEIILSFAVHFGDIVKNFSIHGLRRLLLRIARGGSISDELASVFNIGGDRSSSVEREWGFNNKRNSSTDSKHDFQNLATNGVPFGGQEHWKEEKYLNMSDMETLKRKNRTSLLLYYAEAPRPLSRESENIAHVRRKLLYDIPLKPFQATVEQPYDSSESEQYTSDEDGNNESPTSSMPQSSEIQTPMSIPLSPNRRAMAMNHSSTLSDDMVYLARARLRLDEHLTSQDTTTRVAADFLKRQSRLAVLNPHGTARNISLSCGQHCATKIGSALYSSIRSMVPVLRNRYIFCQFNITANQSSATSLSIGLSTSDMPENALVGAWKHSVGLSSTGQILLSSRWHRCKGIKEFGAGSTVGLLVFVDDSSVYQSWDGEKVTTYCTFSVDGEVSGVMVGPTEVNELRRSRLPLYCMDMTHVGTTEATEWNAVECIELSIPANTDVYPTLTLQSPFTQVQCRFCSADLVFPRPLNEMTVRESIGAPPGVAVYGLDGSIVLTANDD